MHTRKAQQKLTLSRGLRAAISATSNLEAADRAAHAELLPLYFHWGTNLDGLVAKNHTTSSLAALALEHKTSIEAAQSCLVGVYSRHHRSVGLDGH